MALKPEQSQRPSQSPPHLKAAATSALNLSDRPLQALLLLHMRLDMNWGGQVPVTLPVITPSQEYCYASTPSPGMSFSPNTLSMYFAVLQHETARAN